MNTLRKMLYRLIKPFSLSAESMVVEPDVLLSWQLSGPTSLTWQATGPIALSWEPSGLVALDWLEGS